jgi:ABC-2 type transport system permease protein
MIPTRRAGQTSSPFERFDWAIADAWIITRRDIQHWRLQPGTVILGWFFPVLIALMFGLFFGGAIKTPEGGDYFEFLMPGMFTMTMLFGLETTIIAVTTDASRGVTDRFRSMPMSASAVVLGRCIADMINSVVGLAIMIGAGFLMGWRWHGGLTPALAGVGLLLLLRFALLWIGIFIGLTAKGPETLASVQILEWPIGFLSNVFVDPATMPVWLGMVAQWNPLSATASATRALFGNPGWQSGTWVSNNSMPIAIGWSILIVAIFLPLSVRKYRRLDRS